MPRIVRNFWVDLDVDGRQSSIGTGPRSKDGGFTMSIYMRDRGKVKKVANIVGVGGSTLKITIHTEDGKYLQYTTER